MAATKTKPGSKEKKAKVKKPSKAQKIDWLTKKTEELDEQEKRFARSVVEWDDAHAEAAACKKSMELEQQKLNAIVQDIVAIKRGNFTPPLPFKDDEPAKPAGTIAAPAEDVGGKKPIKLLVTKALKAEMGSAYLEKHGISEDVADKLESVAEGKTIADLERLMRKDAWWHKKLDRFGPESIAKLTDAMVLLRRKYPEPSEDDKAKSPTPAQSSANAAEASSVKPTEPASPAPTETIADKAAKNAVPATQA